MSDHTLTLSAGVPQYIQEVGRNWYVLDATAEVAIGINAGSYTYRSKGQGYQERQSFKRLRVVSATAQTVKIAVSDQPIQDNRTEVSVTTTATVEPGNNADAIADVNVGAASVGLISAANANRKALLVSLDADQPVEGIRIATAATVGASAGIWLGPGASIEIPTTAAVYVYNLSATTAVAVNQHPIIKT